MKTTQTYTTSTAKINYYFIFGILFFSLFFGTANAQTGLGTVNPSSSALLDVYSTNKGVLTPRMTTTQRNAITNPALGLFLYNLDIKCFEYFDGTHWNNICNLSDALTPPSSITVDAINGGAILTFDTPNPDPSTLYAIYSNTGELLGTTNQSPFTVNGLTNGNAASFNIVAVGTSGISASSTSSTAVVAGPAPSAPTKFAVRPGQGTAYLSWLAPVSGGSVSKYIIQQRSPLNDLPNWVDIATVSSTTTTFEATGLLNGNGNLFVAREYHFRVKAINGAGEGTSIILKTIPIGGSTLLMQDNFNQVPTASLWQQYGTTGVFAAAGDATSHMYGQASGVWSLVPGNGGSTAQTIQTFNRTNKNIDIQFDWYPDPFSTGNGNNHRFGIFDVVTNSSIKINYQSLNNSNYNVNSFLNDVTSQGSQFKNVEDQIIHVRIVLFKDGSVKVFSNGGLRMFWPATEVPNMFTNIKFFAFSTNTGQPQYIDNFTVSEY